MAKKKKLPDINKPLYRLDLTEEEMYSLGGWLKDNAGSLLSTVAGGAMIATGIGAGAGAGLLASGLGGLAGGIGQGGEEEIKQIGDIKMPRTVGKVNMTPNVMHFKDGGTIHINPANKGKFNALKKRTGKTTEELTHSKNPLTRKRAVFAQNAAKWHHEGGGLLNGMDNEQIYGKKNPLMLMEGPLHEEGGINFLPDAEVEGGETIMNNVVNSDTIKITKDIASQYKLPKKAIGKTVADYSKDIESQFEGREGDPFAMNTRNRMMSVVSRMSAELADDYDNGNKYGAGGSWGNTGLGLPPIFNPTKFSQWKQTLNNQPQLGWGIAKGDERYDPFQNQSNKVPGFYSGIGLSEPIGGLNFSTTPHTAGYQPSNVGPLSVDNINLNPTASGRNTEDWSPLTFDRDQPNPDLIMMDYNKRNGIPNASTSNLKLQELGDGDLTPNTLAGAPDVDMSGAKGNGFLSGLMSNDKLSSGLNNVLGLAPIVMSAFNAARASREKPEKVNIAPIHPDKVNPKLIDPEYQLREVSDAFATANEAMNQVSKKDFLRRRIQSATEESKARSGVLGQTAAGNVQLRNRADEINTSNQLRADMFNTEAGLQEENINAANLGAYQTNRDFQRNNLATMLGEYARDKGLEKANDTYNDRFFHALNQGVIPGGTYDWNEGWKLGPLFGGGTGETPISTDLHKQIGSNGMYELTPEESQYPGIDMYGNNNIDRLSLYRPISRRGMSRAYMPNFNNK